MENQEREDLHKEFADEIDIANDAAGRSAAIVLSMSQLIKEAAESRYPELHGLSIVLDRAADEISQAKEAAVAARWWHEECLKVSWFRLIKGDAS